MGAESETLKHLDEREGERGSERGTVGRTVGYCGSFSTFTLTKEKNP
jgi:hypothetical protein